MGWLRQCAGWLTRLHAGEFPAVNLRPGGDHPERALVVVDLPRVAAILDRIAADIGELARARRVDDLAAAAVLPGRHRMPPARGRAGPGFPGVLSPSEESRHPGRRSWGRYEAERYRRGERDTHPGYTKNPFRTTRQQV